MSRTKRALRVGLAASGISLALGGVAQAQDAEKSWTDNISLGVFVDAYGALRSDNNADVGAAGNEYPHTAYVLGDGFALSWAGADITYEGEEFGATLSLRFGPGVARFYGGPVDDIGIENITQAYATWRPSLVKGLTLDFGMFGTIYGAEVAESWRNINYTRGALYYLMQPFWHAGLRVNYAINDMVALNALVVNGVNNMFEDNKSPSLGLQAVVTPIEELSFAVGYLGALHPRDDAEDGANFDHFFDVVATATFGDFTVIGNFDYNLYRAAGQSDSENWWGISVAPAYAITNWFGVGARVEYLSDSANALFGMPGATDGSLTTITGTLDFKPVPNSGALVLRPEFRYEIASDDYFFDKDGARDDKFWTLVLGAVVTSM